jgi:pimeloyl-ACP methyl ester carboxylesterase
MVAAGVLLLGVTVLWRSSGFQNGSEAASARPAASTGAPARRGVVCAPWDGAETERALATPWGGSVQVREYGSVGCPGVISVHGANPSVVWEWERTARELARQGMRVLLPNLHSDPATKPSGDAKQVLSLLDLLAIQLRNETGSSTEPERLAAPGAESAADIVVMGKSWGGGQALRYAARRPSAVKSIVLVAPMGGGESPTDWRGRGPAHIPALLLYAKDDATFSRVREEKERLLLGVLPKLRVHSIESGGHKVSSEFDPVISDFVGSKVARK